MNQQNILAHQNIISQNMQDQNTQITQLNKLLKYRILKYPTENSAILHNKTQKDTVKIQHSDENIQASLINKMASNFKRYGEQMSIQSPKCKQEVIKVQSVHEGTGIFTIKSQNLKKISFHIKSLIQSNELISIKHLSFLLYQIIAQTNLGRQIYQRNYINQQKSIYSYLQDKYDKNIHQYDLTFVIKNVRRRVYDAINVMIATGIVSKNQKNQLAITQHFQRIYRNPLFCINTKKLKQKSSTINESRQANWQREYLTLRSLLAKKQAILEEKRRNIMKLKKRYVLLEKNCIRNRYRQLNDPLGHKFNEKKCNFELPIMLISSNPQMIMEINNSQFHLYSPSQFAIFSDSDVLQQLLQSKTKKNSNMKNNQACF